MTWLWKPLLLLIGLLLAGLALRGGLGRQALEAPAQLGPAGFVAVAAAAMAVGVPRQLAAYAAGLGFGLWGGASLALLATVIACAADFLWARAVARDWAVRRIRGRLAKLDSVLRRHPFTTTLTLRLMPIGNNLLLNLVAGASPVGAAPFIAASALGYVPLTLVFVLLGAGVAVGQGTQIALGVGLFVAATLVGVLLWRRSVALVGVDHPTVSAG